MSCSDGVVDTKSKVFHYLKFFYTAHCPFGLIFFHILRSGEHTLSTLNVLVPLSLFLLAISAFGLTRLVIDSLFAPICCYEERHSDFVLELLGHSFYYALASFGAISLYIYYESLNLLFLALARAFGALFSCMFVALFVDYIIKISELINKDSYNFFKLYRLFTFVTVFMIVAVVVGFLVRPEALGLIVFISLFFSGGFVAGVIYCFQASPKTMDEDEPRQLERSTAEPSPSPSGSNSTSRTVDIEMAERSSSVIQPRREVAEISRAVPQEPARRMPRIVGEILKQSVPFSQAQRQIEGKIQKLPEQQRSEELKSEAHSITDQPTSTSKLVSEGEILKQSVPMSQAERQIEGKVQKLPENQRSEELKRKAHSITDQPTSTSNLGSEKEIWNILGNV